MELKKAGGLPAPYAVFSLHSFGGENTNKNQQKNIVWFASFITSDIKQ